jgi:CheY-like chemotaxis protein
MDGYQALDRLKESPATERIPVIALTARAMSEEFDQAKNAGFHQYLTKPINLQELMAAVNGALASVGH